MITIDSIRDAAVTSCLQEFRDALPAASTALTRSDTVALSGVGTTAPRAVRGALLQDAFAAERLTVGRVSDAADPDQLFDDTTWDLALVLSPWKQTVGRHLDAITESARRTGVVDTVLRRGDLTIGVNTNTFAAQAAMQALSGGTPPSHVIVLGSGGSSNSVAAAAQRLWPAATIIGSARRTEPIAHWPATYGAQILPAEALGSVADDLDRVVVINTTTWGETDESEVRPFAFDLQGVFRPGSCLFDLNNRVSQLQRSGLEAGMPVMSGIYMQRATNACRAALMKELVDER